MVISHSFCSTFPKQPGQYRADLYEAMPLEAGERTTDCSFVKIVFVELSMFGFSHGVVRSLIISYLHIFRLYSLRMIISHGPMSDTKRVSAWTSHPHVGFFLHLLL